MKENKQMKTITNIIYPAIAVFALGCFALSPTVFAVSPAPDGGYPGGNTAEGQSALLSLTTGTYNTAVGVFSLLSLTDSAFNTAVGAGALLANIGGENTATGAGALLSSTTGTQNTANGAFALFSNGSGTWNTAIGAHALFSNTGGGGNTATGRYALAGNSTGDNNTANGFQALANNTTGSNNIALGYNAGEGVTTASNVIAIGTSGNNVNDSCYIGNIFSATSSGGTAVFANSNGRLGTMTSSARFKEQIKPMGKASEAILALRPVSFCYKKEIDPQGIPEFGLIAEDVEKVSPELVIHDTDGKPRTVRYEQINAMLLNEFLKEHRKVQDLEKSMATLTGQIKEQAAQLHRVSARIEMGKTVPHVVAIDP
jgi:hypothetical protein